MEQKAFVRLCELLVSNFLKHFSWYALKDIFKTSVTKEALYGSLSTSTPNALCKLLGRYKKKMEYSPHFIQRDWNKFLSRANARGVASGEAGKATGKDPGKGPCASTWFNAMSTFSQSLVEELDLVKASDFENLMNPETPQLLLLFKVDNVVTGDCRFQCIHLKPNPLTNVPYTEALISLKKTYDSALQGGRKQRKW